MSETYQDLGGGGYDPPPQEPRCCCDGSGWAGYDARGRLIVCLACKPHLRGCGLPPRDDFGYEWGKPRTSRLQSIPRLGTPVVPLRSRRRRRAHV
jgi:hypothetical protein